MNLINGDCLEELPKLPDKSVDLFFLDLPYGQTACKWDVKLDLTKLWAELKRLAKNERTPFFFSCTTKFGYELIKSNPSWFRWDLVWKKNRASGFLNAYKLPMRQHEMIYCFSKKCPEYDTSSHTEKTVKTVKDSKKAEIYGVRRAATNTVHKDKLPTSDVTPEEEHEMVYCFAKKTPAYDTSSHTEYTEDTEQEINTEHYKKENNVVVPKRHKVKLPSSDITQPEEEHEMMYCFAKKCPDYDVSSHLSGENKVINNSCDSLLDMRGNRSSFKKPTCNSKVRKEPLPTSDITPTELKNSVYRKGDGSGSTLYRSNTSGTKMPTSDITPGTWCEYKLDEKTGHRTAKPVKLMEFILKYWTKEGDTVCDPTAGSGSMGIACKNMNRKFIGIEMDDEIYQLMEKRIHS